MAIRKRLTKAQRKEVYEKYNGHCAYCGCELEIKDMQVDHIKAIWGNEYILDLNTMDNYNPSCRACNFYKDTHDMEKFRGMLQTLVDRLQKIYIFRLAVKYGLITVNEKKIKFYYEVKK